MHLDILIFAIIAAFLIYRLNSVLGTKHGDERSRPNPFTGEPEARPQPVKARDPVAPAAAATPPSWAKTFDQVIDKKSNADGRVETGLLEIGKADASFNLDDFIAGARYAFEAIVGAYGAGDADTLKSLLSPKLFADFAGAIKAREEAGHRMETTIHRIKALRIVEAHLGGTMAYITVDYDVEQTSLTRDETGKIIDGNPDMISNVEDIWTFTRDIRSGDPNWILIETRAAEQ